MDRHESSYDLEFLIKHQYKIKSERRTEIIHWTARSFRDELYSTLQISLSDHLSNSIDFVLQYL